MNNPSDQYVEALAHCIERGITVCHLRLGDGEVQAASYTGQPPHENCDRVRYTPELAHALRSIDVGGVSEWVWHWPYQDTSDYTAIWGDHFGNGSANFAALMLERGRNLEPIGKFWKAVAKRQKEVQFICSEKVVSALRKRMPKAFYSVVSEPADDLVWGYDGEHRIVIGAGGPYIKPLLFDLAQQGYTVIDLGSGLDPVAYPSGTRSGQITHDEAQAWWTSLNLNA